MRLREKLLTSLLLVPIAGTGAWAKERSNFDAFLERREVRPLAMDESAAAARGIHIEHTEDRIGVPSFVWATRDSAIKSTARAGQRPEAAARAHLQSLADAYRLTRDDVTGATLRSVHQTGKGAVVASFGQSVDGIEVFRNEVKVVMDQNLNLVAVSGYLAPNDLALAARARARTGAFRLSAADAVSAAFKDATGTAATAQSFTNAGTKGDYTFFELAPAGSSTQRLAAPARAKKVFFTMPGGLEAAWYVEVNAGPKASRDAKSFSYVISAGSGAVLLRNDLRADAAGTPYKYTVFADAASPYIPWDGPQGNDATPHPTGTPNRVQFPFLAPNVVELTNSPFSRNDPWLPANATQTTGNNVDAYADLGAPDGYQPGVDLRPGTTGPGEFNYVYDTSLSPQSSEGQIKASVVNLFFLNNWLHDWFYDAGFDEVSGNAQALNYGRGGIEGDAIRAEGQDFGGRNNANMSTPADGMSPRMQMYVFDGVPSLEVTEPAPVQGGYEINTGAFGEAEYDFEGELAIPDPAGNTYGCEPLPAGSLTGKVALLDRGPLPPGTACGYIVKALAAQEAGAVAVIIANHTAGQTAPGMGGEDPNITIPSVSTTKEAADAWKAEVLAHGTTIKVHLKRSPNLDRDGTIDNGIIAHEWGHYISNRLIGNANGLVNVQGRSMGEGWGDFTAMLMQVKEADHNVLGNNLYQGVYTVAGYTSSGGANNGYYYGIRRMPYSTDMSKNGYTFKHISNGNPLPDGQASGGATGTSNSEVHNSGEVWATMLWECYASLLNAHPFQEAQDRMKRYIVAAYKATPNAPTFLEARDALLAVAQANDPADYVRFATAFAKRGAGFGAKAPDRNSMDHVGVVESFQAGNNLEVVGVRLDDSVEGCDQDGVLDLKEKGLLHITVRNVGIGAIGAFTGTVSSTSTTATLSFPEGTTVNVPALARFATAEVTVPVQLDAVSAAGPTAGLQVDFDSAELPASAKTVTFNPRVNYDEQYGVGGTDTFETGLASWTSSEYFNTGKPDWKVEGPVGARYIHAFDAAQVSDLSITTPWVHVKPSGNFIFSYKYRHSFESDDGPLPPWFDGAVLEFTVDGVEWYDVLETIGLNPGYADYLSVGGGNPLEDRAAFVGQSTGFPAFVTRSLNFSNILGGLDVQFRFRVGSDLGAGAYGMDLDDVRFQNTAALPFPAQVDETGDGSVCNRRPVANAGVAHGGLPNGPVYEFTTDENGDLVRQTVTLNGTASFDPDGQPLTYHWTQVGGEPVALNDADTATPTFEANVHTFDSLLQFQLVVSDGTDTSKPAKVDVYVVNVNQVPTISIVAPESVNEREVATVTLDGSGTTDADEEDLDYLEYYWEQVGGDVKVDLIDADTAQASFAVPEVAADTQLVFQLTATDGLDFTTQTVAVTVKNVDRAPTANAGADFTMPGGVVAQFTASGADPDGDLLGFTWAQVSGPAVTIANPDTSSPTFITPEVAEETTLTFQLTVTANGQSATDTVDVTVAPQDTPVVDAGADVSVAGRTPVTLRGSGMGPGGAPVTYAWTQVGEPSVALTGADTAVLSFTSPDVKAPVTLAFQLAVTSNGFTVVDTAFVHVAADRAPVVSVGEDRSVAGRSQITLASTASDADGDAITYAWTQVSGEPQVTLSGANTANASFTSPDVKAETTLVFELTVTANGVTAKDSVSITVSPDRAPVANAGQDRDVEGRKQVILAGSGSDAEGDAITYAWEQLSGTNVTLSGANTATPSFTSPDVKEPATLVFELTTTANGLSSKDTVSVHVAADRAPVANAGNDRNVPGRAPVTLAGTASDADGDSVTYAWHQVSGTTVVLTGSDTASPSFTSPDVKAEETLVFELTATANGLTAKDTVSITVSADRAPVANAGSDRDVAGRTQVTLTGAGSDADGDAVSYAWTQTGGDTVTLSGATTAFASFTSPDVKAPATLVFELKVTANGVSTTDTVSITVAADNAPVADAGADFEADARSKVTLHGSATDAEKDAITYAWVQVAGDTVELTGASTAAPTFTAPQTKQPLTLTFELTATANGLSSRDTVTVTVRKANRRPVGQAPAAFSEDEGASITLDASGMDPDGDTLTYRWTQVGGPSVTLTGATSSALKFTAPEVYTDTALAFALVVTDEDGSESEPVVYTVSVKQVNKAPVAKARSITTAKGGEPVVLDASTSTDPDNESLTYAWTQKSGPQVSLTNANSAETSFTAPKAKTAQTFTFEVKVTDAAGASSTKQVSVTVPAFEEEGSGCSSTGGSAGGMMPLMALLAGLALSRRRKTA